MYISKKSYFRELPGWSLAITCAFLFYSSGCMAQDDPMKNTENCEFIPEPRECGLFPIKTYSSAKDAIMGMEKINLNSVIDLAYNNLDWKIIKADEQMSAYSRDAEIVAKGKIDAKGIAHLTAAQRKEIFAAWKTEPYHIWIVGNIQNRQVTVKSEKGAFHILFRGSPSGIESKNDIVTSAEAEAALTSHISNNEALIPKSVYTQAGFDIKKYGKDFSEWKDRFADDLKFLKSKIKEDNSYGAKLLNLDDPTSFLEEVGKHPEYAKELLKSASKTGLAGTFRNSIDGGEKGLMLRALIISAMSSKNQKIVPPGYIFARLVADKDTQPIGYGGITSVFGRNVELWYIELVDLSQVRQRDLEYTGLLAFHPYVLPPFGVAKRDSWPALLFIRGAHGELKMYGVSSEMSLILDAFFKIQIA